MDPLVDNVFGVFPQELQDVLHLGLVGQPPQPDAVPPGAGGDQLLGYHSDGLLTSPRVLTTGVMAHRQAGDQGTRGHRVNQARAGAGLAGVLRGSVQDLLHLSRGGPEIVFSFVNLTTG